MSADYDMRFIAWKTDEGTGWIRTENGLAWSHDSFIAAHNATVAELRTALAARDEALALGNQRLAVIESLQEANVEWSERTTTAESALTAAREALNKIAAWDDYAGNGALATSGSYGIFDEPNSVKLARDTLSGLDKAALRAALAEKGD